MILFEGLLHTLGGLGLFLLGIIIMTSGLQGMAGDLLRTTLSRFTHSPSSGALTGVITTALLQSSSATTVAAVGFVAAGLLTFGQALGVIIGANLGTTVTGWLVAVIGFKLQIGAMSLPFIFVGAMLRLFGKHKLSHLGFALAGFGLVFTGIGEMQNGMENLGPLINPGIFPDDTFIGRIQLVTIGIAITIVTQSSSAGVATALTALHAGSIDFEQAAALVIGMDIGTTITAALASIGGSVATRRTGLSHVTYNLMTGLGALFCLSPYVIFWETVNPSLLDQQAELMLVGFHSFFNLLGVLIILPFLEHFARLMTWLVPERSTRITRHLDERMLAQPMIALELVHTTLKTCSIKLFGHIFDDTTDPPLSTLRHELEDTRHYLDQIHVSDSRAPEWACVLNQMHSTDHLFRLLRRLEIPMQTQHKRLSPAIQQGRTELTRLCQQLIVEFEKADLESARTLSLNCSELFRSQQENIRQTVMEEITKGTIDTIEGEQQLNQARWLLRVSYHLARICAYMNHSEKLLHPSPTAPDIQPHEPT